MTVSSEISRNDRVGNGVLDTFIFEFKIYAKTDILVYVDGVGPKEVDTHYTVPVAGINNPAGGTIVFTAGNIPINLAKIAIILDLPLTQLTDLVEGDKLPAETLETAMDRLVKLAQGIKNMSLNVLKVPVWSTLGDITVPIAAGEFLAWNATGTALVTVPTWEAGDPLPEHHADHELGGIGQISVLGLSGLLADSQTAIQHAIDSTTIHAVPTDITTYDVSITKHGFAPKLPNNAEKYLDGIGTYTIPSKLKLLTTGINKISWTAAQTWADVNITAQTGTDIAKAAYLAWELDFTCVTNAVWAFMTGLVRKNGSVETDFLPKIKGGALYIQAGWGAYSRCHVAGTAIVECDSSQIFEVQLQTDEGTPSSIVFKVNLLGYWV